MWFWAIVCFFATLSDFSNANDGNICRTPNQEMGKCTSIYSCDELLKLVTSKDPEIIRFLRYSFCGWRKRIPLVCCPMKAPLSNISELLPDNNLCGFQEDFNKILRGSGTQLEEFPWMALLKYTDGTFRCGGMLISKRYVLTAGHCATSEYGILDSVRLGEWNLNSTNDCIGSGLVTYCIQAVDVKIESVTLHNNYRSTKANLLNDIALIRLENEVNFTGYIQPICLPKSSSEDSQPGDKLWVSGWGHVNNMVRSNSQIKQKVLLPIVPLETCKLTYDRYFATEITDSQICAGGEGGKDACAGDSGGPLMTTRKSNPLQYYVEGIVSFGKSCGTSTPGVYTRVSAYLDWIKQNIRA